MKSVAPDAIRLSRVYFTEFDRVTYSQVAWTDAEVEAIRFNLKRKLKLLALVKGHVLIAASHLLESELAREVLAPHPRLFSERIVVPTLREGVGGFEALLDLKLAEGKESENYTGQARRDMAQMLDQEVALTVRWQATETSGWFKDRLVADLLDDRGLLRSCMRQAGGVLPARLAEGISQVPHLTRKDVYLLAKQTNDRAVWETVSNYADFLYYLLGAKAVQSEGVLPQENLLDFSLSDLANGRTRLSEREVFFKIFVDLVKASTNTHFPTDFLDVLSIEDVLDLHKLAVEDRFVEKYNIIQQKTKDGLAIHDPERLVLLMSELEAFEEELHREFQAALEKELPRHAKEQKAHGTLTFLNSAASLLIPAWGMATGLRDILISGMQVLGKDQLAAGIRSRMQKHLVAWSQFVDNSQLDAKPVFLAFVRRIKERYGNRMLQSPLKS